MNLKPIHCFILIITMGTMCFNSAYAQQTKPKTKKKEKLDDDGIPKKVKPDPEIDKYFIGGRAPIKSNAITLNLTDPLAGYLTFGFQRKLHRHFMAELGGGPGIYSSAMSVPLFGLDQAILNAETEASNSGLNFFTAAQVQKYKPRFQAYGNIIYAFTGPLVNFSYGIGLYMRYRNVGLEWKEPGNKEKGSLGSMGYGFMIQTQNMVKGRIGWGFNFGAGFESTKVNDIFLYQQQETKKVSKSVGTPGFLGTIKLTYVL